MVNITCSHDFQWVRESLIYIKSTVLYIQDRNIEGPLVYLSDRIRFSVFF